MRGFKPYPAYKDSGVQWLGEVPEHWILTPLKHLALLNPRKSGFHGDTNQRCSFVPMEKLKTGVLQLDEERLVEEVKDGYTYFEDGDVLQAKVTPCFENKNIAVAKGLTNGVGFGSSEINVLRPRQWVSAEYLYYRVQEDIYMDLCASSMIGAGGLKRVPTDVINNFKVSVPKLTEQIQIARFLDHETARIDALIEEQQRLIELLKEKRQAVVSHAVTKGLDSTVPMKNSGVEWLGEVPAHWEVTKIKRRCDLVTDGAHVSPETENGVYCFVSTKDVSDEGIDFEGCLRTSASSYQYLVKNGCQPMLGDVLFSKDGTIGRTIIVSKGAPEFVVASSLIIIRPDHNQLLPEYLHALCQSWVVSQQVEGLVKGAGLPRLSIQNLLKVVGVFPPLNEQAAIADFLQQEQKVTRRLEKEAWQAMELLKERRSALISAAVTGEIDVRDWEPPANVASPELAHEAQ